jgi:hypothetical protein
MTLKVMTWNLENLFRPGTAFGPKTRAIYTEKLEGLAAMIDKEAPDALGLQEVGDPQSSGRPRQPIGWRLASARVEETGRSGH